MRFIHPFLLTLLILNSCSSNFSGNEESSDDSDLHSSDSVLSGFDSTASQHSVQDSLNLVGEKSSYPLLVIENCGALWPMACESEEKIPSKDWDKVIEDYFGTTSLVSIGSKGIQHQQTGKVYCMDGECGQDQLAFRLSGDECHGVLAPSGILGDKKYQTLKCARDWNTYKKHLPTDHVFLDSVLYVSADEKLLIYIGGMGYIQENEWPVYTSLEMCIIEISGDKSSQSLWISLDAGDTNFPQPIAINKAGEQADLIWYQGIGICCPSDSRAWTSTVDLTRGINKTSKIYPGGLGQPCD